MIVNAEGQVLGRLATFVAKRALLGDEVIIVNAEKAFVSGKRDMIFQEEADKKEIRNLGNPLKGPFHERRPDKYVRRSIRGMLPWKKTRGREAYGRIQVYIGVPEETIKKNHTIEKIEIENVDSIKRDLKKYITVADICKHIGGKW